MIINAEELAQPQLPEESAKARHEEENIYNMKTS